MASDMIYFNDSKIKDVTSKLFVISLFNRTTIDKANKYQTKRDKRLHSFELMEREGIERLARRFKRFN